jgi:hypothetical protein
MDEADKRVFWAYTFQALAAAEAGLEPTTNVRHTEPEVAVQDSVTKRTVRQQGLLQLTYMDAERYGCDFNWEQDKGLAEKSPARTILTPKNNLLCGVKILEYQMLTQKKPFAFLVELLGDPAAGAAELPGIRQADEERAGGVPGDHARGRRSTGEAGKQRSGGGCYYAYTRRGC